MAFKEARHFCWNSLGKKRPYHWCNYYIGAGLRSQNSIAQNQPNKQYFKIQIYRWPSLKLNFLSFFFYAKFSPIVSLFHFYQPKSVSKRYKNIHILVCHIVLNRLSLIDNLTYVCYHSWRSIGRPPAFSIELCLGQSFPDSIHSFDVCFQFPMQCVPWSRC